MEKKLFDAGKYFFFTVEELYIDEIIAVYNGAEEPQPFELYELTIDEGGCKHCINMGMESKWSGQRSHLNCYIESDRAKKCPRYCINGQIL